MTATLMLLIGGFIVNPILVNIAEQYENNKMDQIIKTIKRILLILLIYGIVALLGTYFLGTTLLEIIYSIKFKEYKLHLMLVILGAILYTVVTILSTILIAIRKIKIHFIISIIYSIFATISANILVMKYGLIGGFYSYLITMIFRTLCYLLLLISLFKEEKTYEKN